MQSNPKSTPRSPYTEVIELLRKALVLPNLHSWAGDYTFTQEALVTRDLISGVQNASAALSDLVFVSDEDLQVQSATSSQFSSQSDNPGLPLERFAAIPVFSRDNITVGVQVRLRRANEKSKISSSRFLFDNQTCTLFSVEFSKGDRVSVMFMTIEATRGRQLAFLELHGQSFHDLAAKRKISAPFLLNALMSCDVYAERHAVCRLCGTANECNCQLKTNSPSHPMDFAKFAPNMVLHGGEWSADRRLWRRNRDGVLVREAERKAECRVTVRVDEKRVTDMCDLEATGISGKEDLAERTLREVRSGNASHDGGSQNNMPDTRWDWMYNLSR